MIEFLDTLKNIMWCLKMIKVVEEENLYDYSLHKFIVDQSDLFDIMDDWLCMNFQSRGNHPFTFTFFVIVI